MRYRPFGSDGRSSSAVSLVVAPGATTRQAFELMCGALECGVNTISVAAGDEPAAEALRRAVGSVGRGVLILLLRLELEGVSFERQARAAIRASGVGFFDAAVIDRPPPGVLSPGVLADLDALRAGRMAARLGLAGEAEAVGAHLDAFDFDIVAVRYNVASGWAERNVLKMAAQRGLTVLGYGYHIDEEGSAAEAPRGLARLFRREGAARPAAYRFLQETPDWSARQITLAFALTEPGLASVLVEAVTPAELEALSWVVERELPVGVAAQIEMARFAASTRREVA